MNYLAEDCFDVDGKISVWTPKAAHDAEAQPLWALLQSDGLWLGGPVNMTHTHTHTENKIIYNKLRIL